MPSVASSKLRIGLRFSYGLWLSLKDPDQPVAARWTLVFLCGVIAYIALVGNSFEVWENQRFRFYSDAFIATLFALWTSKVYVAIQRRRQ